LQYKDTETVGKFVKFVKRESGFSPLGKTGKEATAKTKTMALTKTKSLSPFGGNGKGAMTKTTVEPPHCGGSTISLGLVF